MTIAELGSLGEFLGGVAVVISLIYVGLQINQNTTEVRHASERAAIEDANGWREMLIEHPEIAKLYREGLLNPDALDPIERLRFRMLLDSLFDTWTYRQATSEDLSEEHIAGTLSRPGGARYWEASKNRFSPEFVEYIEEVRTKVEAFSPGNHETG